MPPERIRMQRRPASPQGMPKPAGAQIQPMPQNKMATPSRTAQPISQNREQQQRAAMDSAMVKAANALGVPKEALNGFTLEELEVLPKAMEKLSAITENEAARREATETMFKRDAGAMLRERGYPAQKSKSQMDDDLKREISLGQKVRRR